MRIAIVSDVHGNLIALEAVLEDLERQRPDLVVHGGDLAFNGPRPAECVERIRQLGWPGVRGNMDEALETHRGRHPSIDWAREQLGEEPNRWLQERPRRSASPPCVTAPKRTPSSSVSSLARTYAAGRSCWCSRPDPAIATWYEARSSAVRRTPAVCCAPPG